MASINSDISLSQPYEYKPPSAPKLKALDFPPEHVESCKASALDLEET